MLLLDAVDGVLAARQRDPVFEFWITSCARGASLPLLDPVLLTAVVSALEKGRL